MNMVSSSLVEDDTWRLSPKRYSDWNKYVRVCAWVLRFVTNCNRTRSDRLLDEELHIEEITDATKQILKVMQQSMFFEEYVALTKGKKLPSKSKLLSLCPKLDEDGIMRADGQLKYAEFLPYDV